MGHRAYEKIAWASLNWRPGGGRVAFPGSRRVRRLRQGFGPYFRTHASARRRLRRGCGCGASSPVMGQNQTRNRTAGEIVLPFTRASHLGEIPIFHSHSHVAKPGSQPPARQQMRREREREERALEETCASDLFWL